MLLSTNYYLIIFIALGIKEYDKTALGNPIVSASAVGLSTFGNLFYFQNRLKLTSSIPGML